LEITWSIYDNDGAPVTGGSASTSLKIRRVAGGFLLDWDDLTFKGVGWVTPVAILDEISAVNLPGAYRKVVDVAAWDGGFYQAILSYSAGAVVRNGTGQFYLKDGLEADPYLAGQAANLDAAVSTRLADADYTAPDNTSILAIVAYVDELESRLTEARAGYLDELGAGNIPADIDTLLTRLTALRASYLDNLSAGAVALEATLTAIKGAGWTTETLKAIKAVVDGFNPVQVFSGFSVTASQQQAMVTIDGSATAKAVFKVGESKDLVLYVKDRNKQAIDLSDAVLSLGVKASKTDTAMVISKDDADFDHSQAASGVVSVHLDETDTDQVPRSYVAELRMAWGSGEDTIVKSSDIVLEIQRAVTD